MLAIAFQVFTINHQAGRTQETTAGVWRLSGKRYASEYDPANQEFTLTSLEDTGLGIRGQVEGESWQVLECQNLREQDLQAFQEMQRILEAISPTLALEASEQER